MFNPQLATFVCVADCGSFSQAAEKLYLSSTAVMKQLNALERHLELKLLERTRRGTVLTPAGEVIYRYARQMFADSERALREARAGAQAESPLSRAFRTGFRSRWRRDRGRFGRGDPARRCAAGPRR